ncbi:MAG: glycosyltransferase family A protein [Myxococcales bacterium]|nr:glycosyltransferase family A protein [Myxococcales bacterium]
METPTVAVVTRTRDRSLFLSRALESVRHQTFSDWHHVVVNDGGPPGAVDELVQRGDPAHVAKTQVVHLPMSVGRGRAANTGLRACGSRLVVFHDDDDAWRPTFLERAVAEWRRTGRPGVVFASERVLERLEGGRLVEVSREPWRPEVTSVSLAECARDNCFTNLAFLAERSAIEAVGGYDETLDVYEDWDLNLRFLSRYDIAFFPEMLVAYHARLEASGSARGSFDGRAVDAANARAALVNRWLRNQATAPIGLLMALGPTLDAIAMVRTRLDKAFNVLHRLRQGWRFPLGGRSP